MTTWKHEETTMSDAELLDRFSMGRDTDAFAELVCRHGPMVTATARRVLRSPEDVQDAVQATFFALARLAGKLREKQAVAAWLHRAAYNSAIEIQRTNCRWERKAERLILQGASRSTESMDEEPRPEMIIAQTELRDVLDKELASLPEKLRAAVVLCDLEGLTQQQAGERLGVPTSTINSRILRARTVLQRRLSRRGITIPLAGLIAGMSLNGQLDAMSRASVTDITAKATLYAAGSSAANLGVAEAVIRAANALFYNFKKDIVMKMMLLSALLFSLIGFLNVGMSQEIHVVAPVGFADREGDLRGTVPPDSARIQFIYSASNFASVPASHRMLTKISFRPDASSGPSTTTDRQFEMVLSTTDAIHLLSRFDDNLGEDALTVFNGPLTFTTNAAPGRGPKEFDYEIEFDRPYFYHPELGNLVIDIKMSGFGHANAFTDSQRIPDAGVLNLWADIDSPVAQGADPVLGVLQFTFVPEPSGAALLVTGVGMLGLVRTTTRMRCGNTN